ncbi:hypothetical protein VNO78_25468 [Psophocarpus tetragonolobus]|uniref:Uncharacterized protein n=1 Tax=Psophocarpus tetragonolobus TaxID=3891 RepID=A0AAN9S5Y4_PSOTE
MDPEAANTRSRRLLYAGPGFEVGDTFDCTVECGNRLTEGTWGDEGSLRNGLVELEKKSTPILNASHESCYVNGSSCGNAIHSGHVNASQSNCYGNGSISGNSLQNVNSDSHDAIKDSHYSANGSLLLGNALRHENFDFHNANNVSHYVECDSHDAFKELAFKKVHLRGPIAAWNEFGRVQENAKAPVGTQKVAKLSVWVGVQNSVQEGPGSRLELAERGQQFGNHGAMLDP